MLLRLILKDFVIVRALDLDLNEGFTVLTGETGAGKSILVDALQLALGNRAEVSAIREGASRLEVGAEFDHDPTLNDWLTDAGFEISDVLVLRRAVDRQGRSRAWINGSLATATQLRAVGDRLLDIHGQHAWQSLVRPDAVRGLLDAFAGVDMKELSLAWSQWRAAVDVLTKARTSRQARLQDRDRLQWQIDELSRLAPVAGEWESLTARHTRLSHAQSLIDVARDAGVDLEGDRSGALAGLGRAAARLRSMTSVEPEFNAMADILAASVAQAGDVAHSLHAYLRDSEVDPQELERMDERMGSWLSLARRYRRSPEELPALLESWQIELLKLDEATNIAQLEAAEHRASDRYKREASVLTAARCKAAPDLSSRISVAMQELGMVGGRFEVSLTPMVQPSASGMEEVAFLVSGHAGVAPKPISKVASGGELSRIALAIAVTTSTLGQAQTLIFDEVDAGVGGSVAHAVGRLMSRLGGDRQVLAVTHLAQVAACADRHLLVTKQSVKANDTDAIEVESVVAPITRDERVQEIARMMGGDGHSRTSIAHAREMLERPARNVA